MIGEITPLVKVANRMTWGLAVVAHTCAAIASATLLGLVLGIVGALVRAALEGVLSPSALPVLAALGSMALVAAALREAGVVSLRLPTLQRQTPQWIKRQFGLVWSSLLWGADLGQGWTTHILYTGYYALVVWAVAHATPVHSALVFAAFGLGRGLPVLVAGAGSEAARTGISPRLGLARQSLLQRVNAVVLALTGVFLLLSSG